MRVIAFDIGDKRIGIALSDPIFNMALPLDTYYRKGMAEDAKKLAELAKSKGADTIVCGMPVNFDGSESYQTKKTRKFVEELQKYTDIKIMLEDERFTTVQAESLLIEADMRRDKRKTVIDKIAASYILENYLKKVIKGDVK
jgi:putative Holliday junction resolvase